jgi:hypothetical protein
MLGRELNGGNDDRLLLCLERVRILDLANAWATSTLDNYRPYFNRMLLFEARFGVPILVPTPLACPPTSPSIALAWCQQQYAWKRPAGKHPTSGEYVSFTTIRKLRSAASTFYEWDIQQANPGRAIREHGSRRPLVVPDCSPTDTLQYALMSMGMGKRLGESNRPPTALQHAQLAGILRFRSAMWRSDASPATRYVLAAAVFVELTGWLGWLRGGEIFGLERSDIKIVSPRRGGQYDLPLQVGMILLKLDPATKASQTRQADVVIAYLTWSGIPYGLWARRLLRAMDELGWTDGLLFRHVTSGSGWDSSYYRYTFLYPVLRWLRDNGMVSLKRFDDSPGMTMEEWFYSMGLLRRGGRSDVSRIRPYTLRAATNDEVHEHGRWRNSGRVDRQMSHHYRKWPYKDRITITWLCQ